MTRGATTRFRGMTLVELLLSSVLAVAVLGALSLVSASLRNDTAEQRTRATLRVLREAMLQYHETHGTWPQGSTHAVLEQLLSNRATLEMVEAVSLTRTAEGLTVLDGFGRPMRYVVSATSTTGEGDFVSAGADGRFGDPHAEDARQRSAAMDNLYGADTEGPR